LPTQLCERLLGHPVTDTFELLDSEGQLVHTVRCSSDQVSPGLEIRFMP